MAEIPGMSPIMANSGQVSMEHLLIYFDGSEVPITAHSWEQKLAACGLPLVSLQAFVPTQSSVEKPAERRDRELVEIWAKFVSLMIGALYQESVQHISTICQNAGKLVDDTIARLIGGLTTVKDFSSALLKEGKEAESYDENTVKVVAAHISSLFKSDIIRRWLDLSAVDPSYRGQVQAVLDSYENRVVTAVGVSFQVAANGPASVTDTEPDVRDDVVIKEEAGAEVEVQVRPRGDRCRVHNKPIAAKYKGHVTCRFCYECVGDRNKTHKRTVLCPSCDGGFLPIDRKALIQDCPRLAERETKRMAKRLGEPMEFCQVCQGNYLRSHLHKGDQGFTLSRT